MITVQHLEKLAKDALKNPPEESIDWSEENLDWYGHDIPKAILRLIYIAKIAKRFADFPCYCEDAVMNNMSAICSPCELKMALDSLEEE